MTEQVLHNSFSKIRSLVFNMAQEHRINSDELEDYNRAEANLFEAIEELKAKNKKMNKNLKSVFLSRDNIIEKEQKLNAILEMIGLSENGVNQLIKYPLRFLVAVKNSVKKNGTAITTENHFFLIEQRFRWFQAMIERDRHNINSAEFHKKLFASNDPNVKLQSKKIIEQMADESNHIIDGLRERKNFDELKSQIENFWYEQVATNSII
jgi:hypothetical protein